MGANITTMRDHPGEDDGPINGSICRRSKEKNGKEDLPKSGAAPWKSPKGTKMKNRPRPVFFCYRHTFPGAKLTFQHIEHIFPYVELTFRYVETTFRHVEMTFPCIEHMFPGIERALLNIDLCRHTRKSDKTYGYARFSSNTVISGRIPIRPGYPMYPNPRLT